MRKKSHISLAKYLVENIDNKNITMFRKSFYYGSILPDCSPSFIVRRHTIEDTFPILQDEIINLTENYNINDGINSFYCRHLGIITHYVADYFTYPHNRTFKGTIKEHCSYENELKLTFRKYVNSDELYYKSIQRTDYDDKLCETAHDICKYIKKMHDEYIKVGGVVKNDCHYIVEICYMVVEAIIRYLQVQKHNLRAVAAAAI